MSVLNSVGHTRRGLFVAAAAVALSGCTASRPQSSPPVDDTPPLRPLLDFASGQVAKLDTAAEQGSLDPATVQMLRDNHAAHAAELARIFGIHVPEGDGALDGDPWEELLRLETEGARQAAEACVAAGPVYATILGEIAACRSAHADALEVLGGR
ncbi:MAG TPA: hypothetical protein H9881_13370 [Candidatus Stackebrandtia excrementipullorum]|nr:hypothetical protein [Candidatus Stackebrandtia excrementipullorum]